MKSVSELLILVLVFASLTESSSIFSQIPINLAKIKIENAIQRSIGDTECAQDLRVFIEDLVNLKFWALEMFDANPKIPSGILRGNIFPFGHYDQCISIKHTRSDGRFIQGQHCSAFTLAQNYSLFKTDYNSLETILEVFTNLEEDFLKTKISFKALRDFKFFFTTCIPKSCSADNLNQLFRYFETKINLQTKTYFHDLFCSYSDKPLTKYPADFYIFCFFGFLVITIISSTIYDCLTDSNSDDSWFTIFSLRRNLKKLLAPEDYQSRLSFLDGIRVLSSIWVVLGHSFMTGLGKFNINTFPDVIKFTSDYTSFYFYMGLLTVDTFFILSGLLVTYIYLSKNTKIGLFQFYFLRWIRFIPALAVIVMFYITIIKHLGSGPLWYIPLALSEMCYKKWYMPLLQVSNLNLHLCAAESWHISVDFQLFLIAPIFVFNIKKHPKYVFASMVIAVLASICYVYYTLEGILSTTELSIEYALSMFLYVYITPISRAYPFLIGISLGYLLYSNKHTTIKIPEVANFILTLISLLAMIYVSASQVEMFRFKNLRNFEILTKCFTFNKLIWCFAVSWIIFYCFNSRRSVVNKFLSHRVFGVLNKLIYCLYLTHLPALIITHARVKRPSNFSLVEQSHAFFGDLAYSYIFALILYLFIDEPFQSTLSKIYVKRLKCENNGNLHRHKHAE